MHDVPGLSDADKQAIDARIGADLEYGKDIMSGKQSGLTPEIEKPQFMTPKGIQSQAIANKVRNVFNSQMEEKQKLDKIGAIARSASNIEQTKVLGVGKLRIDQMRAAAIAQRRMAEEAQRAQVIGSVLGVVGMGVGAMFGGPAGAMVGGGLGQAAGGALAGSGGM